MLFFVAQNLFQASGPSEKANRLVGHKMMGKSLRDPISGVMSVFIMSSNKFDEIA